MLKTSEKYQLLPFPKERRAVADMGYAAKHIYSIYGLVEMDVTEARRLIREHEERTGEAISFTGFITACLGRAVAADRSVQAYRDWRGRLVIFDDVDVGTMIERTVNGQRFPLGQVIRAADKKSVYDIHREIRTAQTRSMKDPQISRIMRLIALPSFVRRLFFLYALRRPHLLKQVMGTTTVTAVGMFAEHGGWGLTLSGSSLGLVIGGISRKPGVVDDQIAIREYLAVTIIFNHEVIDGAPAARFTECFIDLVEGAYGLWDLGKEGQ
jgi:pyruvate/2-oxoglutarate dehydrogenase complex dihydrolipoamide acyltransferase (E2) component